MNKNKPTVQARAVGFINESENLERLDSWLHSKKKGNLHKIPKHNIKNMKFF